MIEQQSYHNLDPFNALDKTRMDQVHNHKPFQHNKFKSEKELHQWMIDEFESRFNDYRTNRSEYFRRKLALYNGNHYRPGMQFDPNNPLVISNDIREVMSIRHSRCITIRPQIIAIPNNNESSDIINSKNIKNTVNCRFESGNFESVLNDDLEWGRLIYGHTFAACLWDESIKDVVYKEYTPDCAFPQLGRKKFTECNDIFLVDLVDPYDVYGEEDFDKFQSTFYSEAMLTNVMRNGMIMKITYLHRATDQMPNGYVCEFTIDKFLGQWNYPLQDKSGKALRELPVAMYCDVESKASIWASARTDDIEGLLKHKNSNLSMIARNQIIAAPKMLIQKGSVQPHKINNDFSYLEFSGTFAPKIMSANPTGQEYFNHVNYLDTEIGKKYSTYEVSRGDVGSNIRSAVAMNYLDEKESQRGYQDNMKRKALIAWAARVTAIYQTTFYLETEDRMIGIIGKDKSYTFKKFSQIDASKVYDFRIEQTSAFSGGISSKINGITALNQAVAQFPGEPPIYSSEQIKTELDLGMYEQHKDSSTVAYTVAKTCIDMIKEGGIVPEPSPSDNLLVHYKTLYTELQDLALQKIDDEIKGAIVDRTLAYELLMEERMKVNPVFAQQVMMLGYFPMFLKINLSDYMQKTVADMQMMQQIQAQTKQQTAQAKADINNQGEVTNEQ